MRAGEIQPPPFCKAAFMRCSTAGTDRQAALLQKAQQQPVADRLRQGEKPLPVQGAAGTLQLLRRAVGKLLGERHCAASWGSRRAMAPEKFGFSSQSRGTISCRTRLRV